LKELSLSIVIVTYQSEKEIGECLATIPRKEEYEVLVIDNGSFDRTPEIVRVKYPWVRLIRNRTNLGYARANNQGIKMSRGEYILLLNPDTRLEKDFCETVIRFMEANPQVSVLAPKILNPDGTVQDSIREFPDYSILLWEITGLAKLFPKSPVFGRWRMKWFDYSKIQEVPQPMTSALLFRRKVFEEVGLFDESFPIYYNDVDLLKRIKGKGLKVFYFPSAVVIHKRGATTRLFRKRMIFEQHKSMYHYFAKYKKGRIFYPLFLFAAILRLLAFYLIKERGIA
jgi:GT2 family glycosyltransferase